MYHSLYTAINAVERALSLVTMLLQHADISNNAQASTSVLSVRATDRDASPAFSAVSYAGYSS